MAGIVRRVGRVTTVTGTVVVLLLTATVTVAAATPRPARSTGWDPRIAPIAREVEKLRHLRFLHPIPARFLSDKAFRKEVTSDDTPKGEDRAQERASEAELRALGLVPGSFDLHKTVNDVQGADVLAFYDSEHKRIVVRGTHLDADHRVTLAHELTHGLQDQHYDLTRLQDATRDSGADDALTALIEGDATRIEDDYYGTLSAADQRAVDAAEAVGPDPGSPTGAPANPDAAATAGESFVSAQIDAPYAVGPGMVYVILDARHRAGLAAAFHEPPNTQLQMLQPSLSATRVTPSHVTAPKLAAGAKRRSTGSTDIGAFDLYFMLASRLPTATAIQAADAWGNGRELVSERNHRICTDLSFTGRDAAGSRRIADALRAWSAAMPAGAVTLDRRGLALHVCDPGSTAAAPPNSAEDALDFAASRAFIESDMVRGGIPPRLTRCMADHMVARPDYQQFVDTAMGDATPKGAALKRFQAVVDSLAQGCIS
jgi:hypothetical protein